MWTAWSAGHGMPCPYNLALRLPRPYNLAARDTVSPQPYNEGCRALSLLNHLLNRGFSGSSSHSMGLSAMYRLISSSEAEFRITCS